MCKIYVVKEKLINRIEELEVKQSFRNEPRFYDLN